MEPDPDTAVVAASRCAVNRTVAGSRRALAATLRAGGIESPELEARILVGYALRLDQAGLAAADTRILEIREEDAIAAVARRRICHEPIARILGRKEFWSLPLRVDAATLVPRPETETVVEAALATVGPQGRARPLRIADLGTGCGALLLALLSELPNALGVGSDTSVAALRVAQDNARRLGLTRAVFVACDMASALGGPFDIIVSNPPYIPSADIAALAPEVRNFDPRLALDGGADGLDLYREIAVTTPKLLGPGGALIVELGAGQAGRVAALFTAGGLVSLPPQHDLNDMPRALVAQKMA